MNALENSVIKYQIDFERYKNGQANEIIELLDKADAEISRFIRQTNGVVTKARYKNVAEKVREVSKSLKNKVDDNIDLDGLIEYELLKEKKLLDMSKKYIANPKKDILFKYPTLEQIKSAALFRPATDGLTYQSYLNGIEAGLFNTWDSAVRTGYLLGQSTNQIVKNVMGSVSQSDKLINAGTIQSLKNSINANTKTLLQSFANETRNMVYEANEQYLGDYDSKGDKYKYEYLATLDNRTCLVCAADDGKLFNDLNDKDTPQLPRHRGCRCEIIPFFNIEGDFRASKEGYKKNVTFDEWLREQDEETQKEVLGATRYRMFKDGITIDQFVDNGKTLTLAQLVEKDVLEVSGGNISASGGILDKSQEEQDEYAERYYKFIRNRKYKTDIDAIAKNTGFSKEKISKVRDHLFDNTDHLYSDNSKAPFTPNAHIAQAWERLEQNKFNKTDIMLLNHEYTELTFMRKKGYNYEKAHWLSNLRYPWQFHEYSELKELTNGEIHKIVREQLKDYL